MWQKEDIFLCGCYEEKAPGCRRFTGETEDHLLLLCEVRSLVRINGRQYVMQPFTFLLHPFEQGSIAVETHGAANYRCVHFRMSERYAQLLAGHGLLPGDVCTISRPVMVSSLWELLQEAQETPAAQERGAYALELLLCLLWENCGNHRARMTQVPHFNKLAALRSNIYLHPADDWNVPEICADMGMCRSNFHRLYLSAFGTTFKQDVIASRIELAKELLTTTEDSVSAVAVQCGFVIEVYFMRQFKRHTGMTATAYRRISKETKDPGEGS